MLYNGSLHLLHVCRDDPPVGLIGYVRISPFSVTDRRWYFYRISTPVSVVNNQGEGVVTFEEVRIINPKL